VLLFLAGCSGIINIENIEDLAAACEAEEPEDRLLSVFFEASDQGCPWGQDGNLQPQDARWSARVEQTQTLDLPEGAVI
jgi:hypothetical protein